MFNGIGLLIQLACVAIVVDGFNLQGSKLWYNLANLTGIALGTLFRFWSYRKWVWKAEAGRRRLVSRLMPSCPPPVTTRASPRSTGTVPGRAAHSRTVSPGTCQRHGPAGSVQQNWPFSGVQARPEPPTRCRPCA